MTALSPECATELLPTKTEGVLTIGVDNPAYPPWYVGDPPEGSDWAFSDPTAGEGYEGATVQALAEVLGFTPEQVAWQFTTVRAVLCARGQGLRCLRDAGVVQAGAC